jgi:SAM-dependent methyltransferase
LIVAYSSMTIGNNSSIKRWSHSSRFSKALSVMPPAAHDRILDFGTGDGHLVALIKQGCPSARVCGFDPNLDPKADEIKQRFPDVQFVRNRDGITDGLFDKVYCLETLEHFVGKPLLEIVSFLTNKTSPDGRILVSVPIETGPASLVKNVFRSMMGQRHRGTTWKIIWDSFVGNMAAIPRPAGESGWISSHLGFDFRTIPALFAQFGYVAEATAYSPVPFLGHALNSQIFFRFVSKKDL